MNLQKEICASFCDGLIVKQVPVGFSISTPLEWFSGDNLSFYARVKDGKARFEDSGALIFDLEAQGVDFKSDNRMEILDNLLNEHGVNFSTDDGLFFTDWVETEELSSKSLAFLIFLSRVQDLLFLNRDIVKSTFKEDVISAFENDFSPERISLNEAIIEEAPHYTVDIVVRSESGKIGAIFAATSDVNVLKAVLFSIEIQKYNKGNIVPFLIYETVDKGGISNQSREIAMNSDLMPAVWSAGKDEVMNKVEKWMH